jgi:hypothetical protein
MANDRQPDPAARTDVLAAATRVHQGSTSQLTAEPGPDARSVVVDMPAIVMAQLIVVERVPPCA